MTCGEAAQEERHRLRDCFQEIRVEPHSAGKPDTVRVIFQRLPGAGRYWRDLMVRLLKFVRNVDNGVTITMAYRTEDPFPENTIPDRASVG
jgi:hypothetical protein